MQEIIDGAALELKAPSGTPIVTALVTPATARAWLETQINNRKIQRQAMLRYRSDILAGRWAYTADPIRFDWDGHLIDGQNRLEALGGINSGNIMVRFAVARGLDPDSQLFMDQGARRTTGQQLGLKGIASGNVIAAGIKLALIWERDQLFAPAEKNVVTANEIIDWAQEHPAAVDLCQSYLARIRNIGLRPSTGLAFVIRTGGAMPQELALFFEELHSLANLAPDSPTLVFAKRLNRTRSDANLHLSSLDQLGFLIRTWNAWVNGTARLRLQMPSGGWTADNFPRVDGL